MTNLIKDVFRVATKILKGFAILCCVMAVYKVISPGDRFNHKHTAQKEVLSHSYYDTSFITVSRGQ